jgi:hypothetical protein
MKSTKHQLFSFSGFFKNFAYMSSGNFFVHLNERTKKGLSDESGNIDELNKVLNNS